jgi:hypothetical protein
MTKRFGTPAGTGATRWGIALVLLVAALVVPAFATTLTIEIGGDVYSEKCRPCHADYTQTDNPKYTFTHGNHITYQCSSCHPIFPHTAAGTDLPKMKDCFNCHGLYHGPQGVLAKGECEACHGEKLVDLRPATHTFDWAKTPHVAPAEAGLTTECSMCHTKNDCDVCHVAENIAWKPPVPMIYDAGTGCLACHGSPNLIKSSADGIVSFHITGLEASAHRDIACPQCHIDFAYVKPDPPTRVWYVNAGMSCANGGCHDHDEQADEYAGSIHAEAIAAGDYTAATCGSCHGGHDIARLDTQAAIDELHLSSEAMCAECHQDQWDNYGDAYHGAAYKRGALDAPACWDCHPAHEVLAADHPDSTINAANIGTTCATCHEQHGDAGEEFATFSAEMIHRQEELRANNMLHKLLSLIPGGK